MAAVSRVARWELLFVQIIRAFSFHLFELLRFARSRLPRVCLCVASSRLLNCIFKGFQANAEVGQLDVKTTVSMDYDEEHLATPKREGRNPGNPLRTGRSEYINDKYTKVKR